MNDMDYKLVICGVSGVGKTSIEQHFFHDLTFEEIKKQNIGPTKDVFSFTQRPLKLGHLTIRGIDTGGQQLLRRKLHQGPAQELCWIGTDACIYVTDFAQDILQYEKLKTSTSNFDDFIWAKINEVKEDIKQVIESILQFTPVNAPVRFTVLFHKWDLLNVFSAEIKDEWKNWLIEQFKEVDNECNYNIMSNNNGSNGGKIKFLGFQTSSILDTSCKAAIRRIIPAYTQIKKILQRFVAKCRQYEANQIYITLLNEDGLEIDSLYYPFSLDAESYFESVMRYFLPTLDLQDRYRSARLLNFCLMEDPDLCLAIQSLSRKISMAIATDLNDINLVRNMLDDTTHSMGKLFKIYY